MKRLALLLSLPICQAWASLEWAQTLIELNVHPAQKSEAAVFQFTNTGEDAISLGAINVSCGCLTAKIQKRTYGPGELGTLEVRFDLMNRTGPQHKELMVTTSDGVEHALAINVNIPELYNLSPVMMKWVKGSTVKTKTAKLTNLNKQPIPLLSAASSNPDFSVELKAVREGYEYEVAVTAAVAASNERSVIRIQTKPPPGQTESKIIRLYVHAQ